MEVPPAVVVDAHDVCTDLDQAQASLREALGGSVAPAAGWKLRVFDERRGKHVIVTANLDDADGNAVAHREIEANSSDRCSGVLSALAVWAALTLDAEVTRARAHPAAAKAAPATTGPDAKAGALPSAKGDDDAAPPLPAADSDAGAPQAKPPKALEIGGSASLMNSPLTNLDAALVGGDIFLLAEVARSLLLRPSLLAATSIGPSASYFGTRMDACLRVPGNYTEHRGLLLDICGGAELAAIDHSEPMTPGDPTLTHRTDALLAFGPSLALRGDLASDLSVEVRGLAGFNVVHTDDTIALLSLRAQVGVTWRLR